MTERKTNTEFVNDLMEFSRFGALVQLFVIQAIDSFATRVAMADPAKVDSPLIAGQAWVGVAKEVKEKLEAHYGPVPSYQFGDEEVEGD